MKSIVLRKSMPSSVIRSVTFSRITVELFHARGFFRVSETTNLAPLFM